MRLLLLVLAMCSAAQAAEFDNVTVEHYLNLPFATPSTVPVVNSSGHVVSSAITPTELGFLSGVTSSIQTQLNGKQASLSSLPSTCPGGEFANAISATGALTCDSAGGSAFYQTMQSNGTPQTQRDNLNFSTNFTLTDSSGSDRTTVDLASTITANLTGNASTATALASDPVDCSSNQVATSIAASGNLGCVSLTGSYLPNPSAISLGGVESIASVSHNFLTSISTSGVPAQAQPAFTDISGSVAAGQLPNPSAASLGGVQSKAATTHQFLTQISTSGVVSAAQPAFTDISGTATIAQTVITTQSISASAIDWSAGSVFSKSIGSSPTTFTFSNTTDGQTIVVAVTATSGTVTWPTVSWSGGTPPTQTSNKTDVYTFIKVGSTFYGSALQNF